jgi:hypothetical protein
MRVLRWVPLLPLVGAAVVGGCDPYNNNKGEFNAGPVDSANYPATYLGAGYKLRQAGSGVFVESKAYVNGVATGYFNLGPAGAQLPRPPATPLNTCASSPPDPLRLVDSGKPVALMATQNVYRFDGKCSPPPNYAYDQVRDDLHYDQQGNLFTAIPTTTYFPVVAENVVNADGLDCQSIKSEATLLKKLGMQTPTGKLLFWPIIDAGAAVYAFNDPNATAKLIGGVGLQSYGWYQQYYLAYLDGGYVATEDVMVTELQGAKDTWPACTGTTTKMVTRLKTQKLYYPTIVPQQQKDGSVKIVQNAIGLGFDVLEAARSDAGYSPVCAVYNYTPQGSMGGDPTTSDVPQNSADIIARYTVSADKATPYIYCPQVVH